MPIADALPIEEVDAGSLHSFSSGVGSVRSDVPSIVLSEDVRKADAAKHGAASDSEFFEQFDGPEVIGRVVKQLAPDFSLPSVEQLKQMAEAAEFEQQANPDPFFKDLDLFDSIVFRGTKQTPEEIFNTGFIKSNPGPARYEMARTNDGNSVRGIRGVVSMSSKPQVSEDYARHTGSAENYNPGGYLYAAQLSSGGKKAETGAPGIDVKEVVAPYVPAKDIVFGIGPLFLALGNGYRLAGGQLFINPDSTVDSNAAQKAFEKTKYLIDYVQSGSDEMEVNLPFSERYRLRQELLNNEVPEAALTLEGSP